MSKARWLALLLALLLPLLLPPPRGGAQSGVLIPSTLKDTPDDSILSLASMNVDVLVDNQHARVRVLQIFDSHSPQVLEGKYLFDLGPRASVSDFAVWDGDTRVPGVMMEKRRAEGVYAAVKQQQVDPGLLQQDDEQGGATAFSAKVFPIPARGTKRVEMEYTETLPVDELTSRFSFPLKPVSGAAQRVGELNLHVRVLSDYPVSTPAFDAASYPVRVLRSGPNDFEAEYEARDVTLAEDFAFSYRIEVPDSALSVITYRAPEQVSAYDLRDPASATPNPDGYFQATALFNQRHARPGEDGEQNRQAVEGQPRDAEEQPRSVVVMLDTSLSMRGDKLARAFEAVDYFLHGLTPRDSFNLLLFNSDTSSLSDEPLPASTDAVERALDFVRASSLGGGTDLRKALNAGLALADKFPAGDRSLVLVSDANPTLGTSDAKKILAVLKGRKQAPARIFAFALGGDADDTLMKELARSTHGHYAEARETEDIALTLKLLFRKVGVPNVEGVRLAPSDPSNFSQVYATDEYGTDGSSFSFVGRYRRPQPQASLSVTGTFGAEALTLSRSLSLPEFDDTHAHLPRVWARARVDALLREMDLNGEREDYIAEVIRLSQKYKFVTPYTAFIAAPRALLRPRLIQPGDPVIRVKTDPSIKSVFAVLPFGETLPLKFLASAGVWEGRFLAPAWMPDGAYRCRLLLTDEADRGYEEEKSFVVDSHAPKLKLTLASGASRAGEELKVRASADADTVRLTAKMYGAQPVELRWSDAEKACVGSLRVPARLAPGRYVLTVSAEDFAHNQSSAEVEVEVVGR
ncbi:MAG TPA: VIT and VWA domain-containing protein [Pyrinomonadaceae bacterium]|nr:VIT and VWA domain-containing protein [Pyrinomonadaceae bacterium]